MTRYSGYKVKNIMCCRMRNSWAYDMAEVKLHALCGGSPQHHA